MTLCCALRNSVYNFRYGGRCSNLTSLTASTASQLHHSVSRRFCQSLHSKMVTLKFPLFWFSYCYVLGFMVLNFPLGRIFLGDGGAYALGHLLVWSAIILINSSTEISTFAILLIFFWPVADTGLAIWRRWKLGNPTDRPDRLHFHQLAMRFLEIRFFGRDRREITNPLATLILIPLISAPQLLGILFWDNFKAP